MEITWQLYEITFFFLFNFYQIRRNKEIFNIYLVSRTEVKNLNRKIDTIQSNIYRYYLCPIIVVTFTRWNCVCTCHNYYGTEIINFTKLGNFKFFCNWQWPSPLFIYIIILLANQYSVMSPSLPTKFSPYNNQWSFLSFYLTLDTRINRYAGKRASYKLFSVFCCML